MLKSCQAELAEAGMINLYNPAFDKLRLTFFME